MMFKTISCGMLRKENVGESVILNGWVQRRRDLGGLLFIDLRDRTGIVQIVFNPDFSGDALLLADRARNEYVLAVKGRVVERDTATINPNLETGQIEVQITEIEILNSAKNPPFFIEDGIEIDEPLRLKYRYLDLRRPEMQKTLKLRSKASKVFRDFLDSKEFIEVETPILTKSTPEGARDYLVPSRVHPGEFFALPQSPQIFKQLLMVGGLERYYQIARCFRDEDLRSDRQPEFTQVDIETSFMSEHQLQDLMEELIVELFDKTIGVQIERPFQRLSYSEAVGTYGSDKPDLRFDLPLVDLSDIVASCGVKVFASVVESGGQVKAINAKGCAGWSRKEIDDLGVYAGKFGAKGLAWVTLKDGEIKGPIVKFFTEQELAAIKERMGAEEGDLIVFSADKIKVVTDVLGAVRLKLGRDLGLIDDNIYKFAWVLDFPMLEYDDEAKRYVAMHHPFTRPKEEDMHYFDTDPGKIRAQAYDIVLNGYEVGGGSMRIYKRDVQEKMFEVLGFTKEAAVEQFGFLMEAFEYGTPPHGGIAFGLDRLIMLLAKRNNLRETIAFPKTASATDLLCNAPSGVEDKQLQDLSIRVAIKEVVKAAAKV